MSRSRNDEDDEAASLAFALKLQEEFDKLASTESSQQHPSIDDDYLLALQLQADYDSQQGASSSNGKTTTSDEELARQLQAEADAIYNTPTHMSDYEFAKMLQMQEDGLYNASTSSSFVPLPPPPTWASPPTNVGKVPWSASSPSQGFKGPPPLPPTPGQPPTSPSFYPPAYPFHSDGWNPQAPPVNISPSSPVEWTKSYGDHGATTQISGFPQPLEQHSGAHSSTVCHYKLSLNCRAPMKY